MSSDPYAGLLTQHEAAQRVGVNERTIRKWVAAGRLPIAHQFPGRKGLRLFQADDVDRAARLAVGGAS